MRRFRDAGRDAGFRDAGGAGIIVDVGEIDDADGDTTVARSVVARARRITVLTGAGISTDSGIPDFRGPQGVWTTNPGAERMSDIRWYVSSREVRETSWQSRAAHPAWHAEPNAAHRALVALQAQGRLHALLTQNIDGLHQQAGSAPGLVVELHGTMFETECLACGDRDDMRTALDRVVAGESDPSCQHCGGILKSATISFGQSLDPQVLDRARAAARECDLMLAVGSSLTVNPAAGLVATAVQSGAAVVICNASETPYDELAEAIVREPLGEVLPALVR